MISVRIEVKGEPDTLPFATEYHYGTDDEVIFFNGEAMIQDKLARGLKINTNEALTFYCSHVVRGIRAGKSESEILSGALQILSTNDVMIGTPETLSQVTVLARVDSRHGMKIKLKNPISDARLIPN
jgi:urease gamma subunit